MKLAFYLDEHFPVALAGELITFGHVPYTTLGEQRLGASDAHQVLLAAEQGWTFLTHNRDDFSLLHEAWLLWSRRWGVHPEHAGILAIEQYPDQKAPDNARAVESLVADDSLSLANTFFERKRSTGWQHFRG